jgi:hypothetical protein
VYVCEGRGLGGGGLRSGEQGEVGGGRVAARGRLVPMLGVT